MASEPHGPTIGEVASLVRGNTYKSALLGSDGPVLLGLGTIQKNGGFRADSLKTYGGPSADKILLAPGDLYVSLKDVTQSADLLGAIGRLPESVPVGRLTQDTVKLDFTGTPYPKALLYWALRTPQYRAFCRDYATGTTNLGLAREDFLAYRLPAPNSEILALVELLETIEDRIEVLPLTNATLEAIAEALFKSWFVDFDPVRAKAEGREPEGMDATTAALFPSEFKDSEFGPIPESWRVGKLEDLLILQRGFDLPAKDRVPGSHPVIAASGLNGTHSKAMVHGPGVITGRSGVLGKVFIELSDFWPLNTTLWVREFKAAGCSFAYGVLSRLDFKQFNTGSVVPTLNRNHVHSLSQVVPLAGCINAFEEIVAPIHRGIQRNLMHSQSLAGLRDVLLPRLISGWEVPSSHRRALRTLDRCGSA